MGFESGEVGGAAPGIIALEPLPPLLEPPPDPPPLEVGPVANQVAPPPPPPACTKRVPGASIILLLPPGVAVLGLPGTSPEPGQVTVPPPPISIV